MLLCFSLLADVLPYVYRHRIKLFVKELLLRGVGKYLERVSNPILTEMPITTARCSMLIIAKRWREGGVVLIWDAVLFFDKSDMLLPRFPAQSKFP